MERWKETDVSSDKSEVMRIAVFAVPAMTASDPAQNIRMTLTALVSKTMVRRTIQIGMTNKTALRTVPMMQYAHDMRSLC